MFKKVRFILLLLLAPSLLWAVGPGWKPLENDDLHDPTSPAIGVLQEPAEALSELPRDSAGNLVAWIKALEDGYIEPRSNVFPDTEIEILEMDIIMDRTGEMPLVMFPHRPHTEWLDCKNCHDEIFKEEVDANPINMFAILQGEYCGRCHGAVAFPLTECLRCHSIPRSKFKGKAGVQENGSLTSMERP